MINYGPLELTCIVSLLTLFAYLIEDGKSTLRYIAILTSYLLSLIMLLDGSETELYTITCLVFMFFLTKRLLLQVMPLVVLGSNRPITVAVRSRNKAKLANWEQIKSRNLMYLCYCLLLMLGIVSINYF